MCLSHSSQHPRVSSVIWLTSIPPTQRGEQGLMSFRGDYCDLSTHLWGVKRAVKERKGKSRESDKPHHRACVLTFTFFSLLQSLIFSLTAPKAILCACQDG